MIAAPSMCDERATRCCIAIEPPADCPETLCRGIEVLCLGIEVLQEKQLSGNSSNSSSRAAKERSQGSIDMLVRGIGHKE
mmetsp:Transcript_115135/g.365813  ORF Transcript_115135/g.365813 Transcript_115135/m.365813 type:complete len:80 (-) Transcript_115135:19-258(-)